MLKIKDNVNLKELEKYGFVYEEDYEYDYLDKEEYPTKCWTNGHNLYAWVEPDMDRCFDNTDFGFDMTDVDALYDLIKDGLVEKVDEEC